MLAAGTESEYLPSCCEPSLPDRQQKQVQLLNLPIQKARQPTGLLDRYAQAASQTPDACPQRRAQPGKTPYATISGYPFTCNPITCPVATSPVWQIKQSSSSCLGIQLLLLWNATDRSWEYAQCSTILYRPCLQFGHSVTFYSDNGVRVGAHAYRSRACETSCSEYRGPIFSKMIDMAASAAEHCPSRSEPAHMPQVRASCKALATSATLVSTCHRVKLAETL